MMDAKEAIARSISHDEIAYCADTQENRDTLLAECDETVAANGILEYWANDPDSNANMLWRVHIEKRQLEANL